MERKIVTIAVKDGEDEYTCRVRRPDVATLARASKIGKADEVLAAQELLKGCWVDGDNEILEDGYLMITAAGQRGVLSQGLTAAINNA